MLNINTTVSMKSSHNGEKTKKKYVFQILNPFFKLAFHLLPHSQNKLIVIRVGSPVRLGVHCPCVLAVL